MKGYEVNIVSSTKELSPKEKIKLKDLSNSINLDNATQAEGKVVINYDYHVLLNIHNEKSKDRKDYQNVVVVDKDGTKYNTGSESFLTTLEDITGEMLSAGEEDFSIEVYRKDSKNYKGKQFITCSVL
jgi:hypothetical protein